MSKNKDVTMADSRTRAALVLELAGDVGMAEMSMVHHLRHGFSDALLAEVGGDPMKAEACVIAGMRDLVVFKTESVEKVFASGGDVTLNPTERKALAQMRAFLSEVPPIDIDEPLHHDSCAAADAIRRVRAFSVDMRQASRELVQVQNRRKGGMVFLKSA
jgi:hypothetical protein